MKTISTKLQTESALDYIKTSFPTLLSERLHLTKVSSPMVVLDGTGINDDLNGVEKPVSVKIKSMAQEKAIIVHSLAKWKRLRLQELEIPPGAGLLTDMRALRPDEDYTPLHSIYVDQWDWEKHITTEDRSLACLKETVVKIYEVLFDCEQKVGAKYPHIKPCLPQKIHFIHAEDLLALYPTLSPKQREQEITKTYGAVFLIGIGGKLKDGEKHDGRAPDYDDWSTETEKGYKGLNGDILVWHPELQCAFEISSMGIRVDENALKKQLKIEGCEQRLALNFHKKLVTGSLPLSIGGGIGQSRVCMFLLKKIHIGEVQIGVWPAQELEKLKKEEVDLL